MPFTGGTKAWTSWSPIWTVYYPPASPCTPVTLALGSPYAGQLSDGDCVQDNNNRRRSDMYTVTTDGSRRDAHHWRATRSSFSHRDESAPLAACARVSPVHSQPGPQSMEACQFSHRFRSVHSGFEFASHQVRPM